MTFTQMTAKDLLSIWQNSASEDRDIIIGDALFPQEYSLKSPPRFSRNIKDEAETDKLLSKLNDLGFKPITIESLPRSSLSVVRCGDVVIPPMPAHKGIGFIGYCAAKGL